MTSKLAHCRKNLIAWCKSSSANSRQELGKLQQELDQIQLEEQSEMNDQMQKIIVVRINSLWMQEEAYWFQRARTNWIQIGDKNSQFFHALASKRRQNNFIFQLKDEHGTLLEGTELIKTHVLSHFQQVYTSRASCNYDQIARLIRPSVTLEMNDELCRPVSDAEIQAAVFQQGAFKAPKLLLSTTLGFNWGRCL
ncbi:hypothetical protein SLA2020_056070 [Shorea laevis]